MGDKPRFIDFPVPPNFFKSTPKIGVPLSYIFASQSVDHAVSLILSVCYFFLGTTLFKVNFETLILNNSPVFWAGALFLLTLISFFYRVLARLLLGQTLGNYLMGLHSEASLSSYILGTALESLVFIFPFLWALEFMSPRGKHPLGLNYTFCYGRRSENTLRPRT